MQLKLTPKQKDVMSWVLDIYNQWDEIEFLEVFGKSVVDIPKLKGNLLIYNEKSPVIDDIKYRLTVQIQDMVDGTPESKSFARTALTLNKKL